MGNILFCFKYHLNLKVNIFDFHSELLNYITWKSINAFGEVLAQVKTINVNGPHFDVRWRFATAKNPHNWLI